MSVHLTSKDLNRLRDKLVGIRVSLTGDIRSLEGDALKPGDSPPHPDNPADFGSDTFSREFSLELLAREESTLDDIDAAIERLDGGCFGICERCKRPIAKARLAAIPFAHLCIRCKNAAEKV